MLTSLPDMPHKTDQLYKLVRLVGLVRHVREHFTSVSVPASSTNRQQSLPNASEDIDSTACPARSSHKFATEPRGNRQDAALA